MHHVGGPHLQYTVQYSTVQHSTAQYSTAQYTCAVPTLLAWLLLRRLAGSTSFRGPVVLRVKGEGCEGSRATEGGGGCNITTCELLSNTHDMQDQRHSLH